MIVALSIVGGFAMLFSLVMMIAAWKLDSTERSDGIGVSSTIFVGLFVALFVCALSMSAGTTATITVALVGGFAVVGAIINGFFTVVAADYDGWGACIAVLGVLLVIATYVLALCYV